MSEFSTSHERTAGAALEGQPGRFALLAAAALLLVAVILTGIVPMARAESDGIAATPPSPKWLDLFCIGNEQCATGDFDGDGKDDVLTFTRDTRFGIEQGDVYVALSTGLSFAPAQKWSDFFCTGQDVCKVGDVDADGRDDLISFAYVASGPTAGDVYVARSTGAGFAPAAKWQDAFCTSPEVCDVGDFNGDGATDLVAFTRNSYAGNPVGDVWVGLSNSYSFANGVKWQEFFCLEQEQCGVGDFDGDGRDDIASFAKGNSPRVFVALSNGYSFVDRKVNGVTNNVWNDFFCYGQETCGIGDFTGDGKADVIAFIKSTQVEPKAGNVYVAISSGSLLLSSDKEWSDGFCTGAEVCGVGDFDGNGQTDVIRFLRDTQLGDNRGDVYVALAGGGTRERGIIGFPTSKQWSDWFCLSAEQCAVGDVNGDGMDDVIAFVRDTQTGTGRGDVYVALSNRIGFTARQVWADFFCTGSDVCKVADVNGDGRDDLVAFKQGGSPQVIVATSNGGGFDAPTIWHYNFCASGEVCDLGDFNGDGKADIVLFKRSLYGGTALGDVLVTLSTGSSFGDGVSATQWNALFCVGTEQCGVGDFDGDGRDDIVAFVRSTTQQPKVFVALSNGVSFVDRVVNGEIDNTWNQFFCYGLETCGIGDFNGDGKADVVTFLKSTQSLPKAGDVAVALSNGSQLVSEKDKWNDFFCLGDEVCGVGDFDGDQTDDIITFLRNTQSEPKAGDVYVATGEFGVYYFRYTTTRWWVPFITR